MDKKVDYYEPVIEIIVLGNEDTITTSNLLDPDF